MANAYIVLSEGYEEIEFIAPVDILRRAKIALKIVTLKNDLAPVKSARGVMITPEILLKNVRASDFDMLILPGGWGGTVNMKENTGLLSLVKEACAQKKYLAAICAAPIVFVEAGIAKGRKMTSHPDTAEMMKDVVYQNGRVVVDDHFITSRGPGTAIEFALKIVEILKSKEEATAVNTGVMAHLP